MTIALWLVVLAAVVGLVFVVRHLLAERKETARVRALFSRYVAPPVVDELLRRKNPRLFEGQSSYVTIMVCRIWNFSHVAEELTPEETLRYLNEIYTLAGSALHKHRGMIDRFTGDGVVGVFGAPVADPFHEEHAVRCALDLVRYVDAMGKRWLAAGRKPISIGIGISSGRVVAGDAGFQARREYAVVGVEALVAQRLQEVSVDLGAAILISNATYKAVSEIFASVAIPRVPLRGMRRVEDAWVIRGLARHAGEAELLLPAPRFFQRTTIAEAQPPEPAAPPQPQPPAAPGPQGTAAAAAAAVNAEPPKPRTARPAVKATPLLTRPARLPLADTRPVDTPAPPLTPRRRRLFSPDAGANDSEPIPLPELRLMTGRADAAHAEFPEPPGPPVHYEDSDGPPLPL
jgi:class 3 adenylate cyclase